MSENTPTGAQHPDSSHRQSTDQLIINTVMPNDDINDTIRAEHQSIPQQLRDRVFSRDGYCQVCGCGQPDMAETRGLLVQRIDDSPTHCDPDDPENLVTWCLDCACWIKQMPSRDDLPPVLQERVDGTDLDADHIEILRYLHETGPARTGEITDAVDRTNTTSVRRTLYDLMSLDARDDAVSGRLVVKDRLAGTYGLPWQIPDERDARGVVPLEPHVRRTRILDAVVDRLLKALDGRVSDPREVAATVVDREPNQTYNMEKRARALRFPFEQWAEIKRSRHDEAAAIEAVGILAGATDNISRRHVADPLVEILEQNEEHELATVLRQSLLEDADPPFAALAGQSTVGTSAEQSTADASSAPATASEETAEHTELQVFNDPDANGRAGGHTDGDSVQECPHSEDQNR